VGTEEEEGGCKFIEDFVQASEAGIGPSEAKAMLRK